MSAAADPAPQRWLFADADFDEAAGILLVAGQPVDIEPRPLRLLAELLRRVDEVVTRDELLDTVWFDRVTTDHVLASAVSKLRAALGDQAGERIVTMPRVGYRLLGPVHCMAAAAAGSHRFQAGQSVPGRPSYVLERVLGQGGAGDVWLARHDKLDTPHVFKFAEDGQRLAALKREYTLYRVLLQELGQRPDIAVVIDANFQVAPYFLECAYGGENLAEWAAHDGRLQAMPLEERLALFLQIASAVAAAHGVGVLHKDLKPGNVLVSGEPGHWQARLTDFGSGRLLDLARLDALKVTAMGLTHTQSAASDSRSGTLLYMAPEVLNRQPATVQSDVYALGLLLHQMAVGDLQRPLAPGWERAVDDELLRADIAHATDGDPGARTHSAGELVDNVRQLPERRAAALLEAEARGRDEQERTQANRRRALRPWVFAAFGSLALGLVLSLWFYSQAAGSLRDAQQQAQRAEAINDFLKRDVLVASQMGRSRSGAALTMTSVLQRASERATARFAGQPELEAAVRLHLAQSLASMDDYHTAAAEYQRALALWSTLRPATDAQRLQAQFGLAGMLAKLSRKDEAKAMLDAALGLSTPAQRAAMPEVDFAAERAAYLFALSAASFKMALQHADRMQVLADTVPGFDLTDRANARLLQAEAHYQLNDLAAAGRIVGELSAPPFSASAVGPVLTARTLVQRARQETNAGNIAAAEATLQSARKTLLETVGPTDYYVGIVGSELGDLYSQSNRPAQAAPALAEAVVALRASLGPDHPYVHMSAVNKAFIEIGSNQFASALQSLDAERPWFAARPGDSARVLLQGIDFRRAIALTSLGRPTEALEILNTIDASALAQASWGKDWPHRVSAERGRALLAMGQRTEGIRLLRDAVAAMRTGCAAGIVCDGGYADVLATANGGKR